MAIQSRRDVWHFFKRQIPDVFIKRKFNFITIHYLYIMGNSVLWSVIIYGIGGIPYIDALFFASGASTQSGLNTIDINNIHTGQQVALYLAAMFCNPIFINSFVVFVRLYWFEKRFKDVVREARTLRSSKSRSRTNTMNKDDPEAARQELGVRGRAIRILRNTGRTEQPIHEKKGNVDNNGKSVDSSDTSRKDSEEARHNRRFDDEIEETRTRSSEDLRLPQQLSSEQHIRFLENQRNPRDSVALRIPSPREFDRGGKPENIDENNEGGLMRRITTHIEGSTGSEAVHTASRPPGPHFGPHITINEPSITRLREKEKTNTFPRPNPKAAPKEPEHEIPGPLSQPRHKRSNTFSSFRRTNTGRSSMEATPYLSYEPTIGRNSFFVNLTEEQREELGGIEYRALKTLAIVLVVYFLSFHVLGIVCLMPWIMRSGTYAPFVTQQNQGRPWWAIFTAASAFNDLGFTLTNNSMISFGTAVFPMLLMSFLIIIGNTGFPCMLRFVIWMISKIVPYGSGVWEEFQFLLDHPRRCFTLLFPRGATWWLFVVLVILNGLDLMFFVVLDLNDPVVTSMSGFIRFIDGLFQAASTRTAGFAVVNLAELHPAIQVSYLIMMYISVLPIAISMRRTNVYEEKSLGIYASPSEEAEQSSEPSYVGAHLRKQLSFDLWYVFLGLFIIAIVEGKRLQNANDYSFTLFTVLFEIVSAYGTVGLSLGYPTINASFSTEFKTLSKLVIIAMQIRGRHRGLPYELDRAILLPSESLQEKEAREGRRIMRRRSSAAVDGQLDSHNFRPETGLSSGFQPGVTNAPPRERAATNKTNHSAPAEMAEKHQSHARHGLGNAMYKLASAPDRLKEGLGMN